MTFTVIAALIAGLAGAVGTFLVAARKFGGQIKTSTAEMLWKESSDIRKTYRADVEALRLEIAQCRERISVLEHDNDRLHAENHVLQTRVEKLTRENERLRIRIAELEGVNTTRAVEDQGGIDRVSARAREDQKGVDRAQAADDATRGDDA